MNTALACGAPCHVNLATDQDEPTELAAQNRAMIRQICSIKLEYVAPIRSSELLSKLEREVSTGLGMWSVVVVQSEQHVTYTLMAGGGGREDQAYMEETDRLRRSRQLTLKKGAPGDQV